MWHRAGSGQASFCADLLLTAKCGRFPQPRNRGIEFSSEMKGVGEGGGDAMEGEERLVVYATLPHPEETFQTELKS